MKRVRPNSAGKEPGYGGQTLPETRAVQVPETANKMKNEELKRSSLMMLQDLGQDLATLEGCFASLLRLNDELARSLKEFYDKSGSFLKSIETLQGNRADLIAAAKGMQEMQMSFNLQYLQLQNQMQNENRQFTMVSNIMKTKHDTVKNSINNIR